MKTREQVKRRLSDALRDVSEARSSLDTHLHADICGSLHIQHRRREIDMAFSGAREALFCLERIYRRTLEELEDGKP